MATWRLALWAAVAVLVASVVVFLGLSSFPASAQQDVGGGFRLRHSFGSGDASTTVRPWVQGGDHVGSGSSGSSSSTSDGLGSALGNAFGQGNSLSGQGGGNIGGKAVGKK